MSITNSNQYDNTKSYLSNGTNGVNNNNLEKTFKSKNIHTQEELRQRYTRFFRWGYLDHHNVVTGIKQYLFFTKPNLFLFNNSNLPTRTHDPANMQTSYLNGKNGSNSFLHPSIMKYSSKLVEAYAVNPDLFYQLTRRVNFEESVIGNFMPLLTNLCDSTLDIPAEEAQYSDMVKTTNGAIRSIRGNSYQSTNGSTFTLEFKDTKSLEVLNLARIYNEYMNLKSDGLLDISGDSVMIDEIINKIDSDTFTIYSFIVDDTGENILYYSKFWGVSISNVPHDVVTNIGDGKISIPLEFKYELVESNNPAILTDFNKIGIEVVGEKRNYKRKDDDNGWIYQIPKAPIWDNEIFAVNGAPVGCPYVLADYYYNNKKVRAKYDGKKVYKLRWFRGY